MHDIDYPAPDPAKPYVYPGTQVLINRFGIGNMDVLQRVVNTVAGLRGAQLDDAPVAGDFDLAHLCALHRVLFQDVFAWAGQVRTVDIEKREVNFVRAVDIAGCFRSIHDELVGENFLRALDPEEFASRLAHHWYRLYLAHAFRDGNSRTLRHFCTALARAAGYRLDFAALDRKALSNDCRHRYFSNDGGPLRDRLRQIAVAC